MPKITYLMRTTSPSSSNLSVWKCFDGEIREALSRLLRSNLEEKVWEQAKLPISMSGLSLCSAAEHSSSAFLGSILYAENRIKTILKQDEVAIDMEEALDHFKEVIEDPSITSVEHFTQVEG